MLSLEVTFPIARREMLVLAKSPGLYRTRITSSLALLFLGTGFGALYHYVGLMAVSQVVPFLTFLLLMICLFAGVHLTADSISREKREGTLGLLFLTPLTPFQIVLGKLVAHGLMGFYSVLIVVPLLSLIMIAGGLRLFDVFAIGISALNILFFSCAVGLWSSTYHTERKKAGAGGTWIVVFFWWGIPIIVQLLNYLQAPALLSNIVGLFAVNGMFNSAFAGPRVRILAAPWLNLLCIHLTAWCFIGLATASLRKRWQDQPPKQRFALRQWWKNLSLGDSEVRRRLRQRLLDQNPFLWLASRDRLRALSPLLFTLGFLCFIAWQFHMAGGGPGAVGGILIMVVTITYVQKVMISALSAHQLGLEQEQGTLEMLLSTPLSAQSVMRGQIMASRRQFRGPAILCILAQVAAIVAIILLEPFGNASLLAALAVGAVLIFYLMELHAMILAGMWGAVTVKEAKNAAGSAMFQIIFFPALVFGLLMAAWSIANWYFGLGLNANPLAIFALYFLICAVNDVFWIRLINARLPVLIREFALRRYTPPIKKSWFARFRKTSRLPPPILTASGVRN
jgi:ABC-type transport system involved in multi-copper enzyme maturation permease subunit